MQAQTKQTLKIFWQHLQPYKVVVGVIAFLIVVAVGLDITQPILYRQLFNLIAGSRADISQPVMYIGLIFLIAVLYNFAWRIIIFLVDKYLDRVRIDLLNTCYRYIMSHSTAFFNNSFVGALVSKISRYDRA
nr:hypothetical protein [bacterium]